MGMYRAMQAVMEDCSAPLQALLRESHKTIAAPLCGFIGNTCGGQTLEAGTIFATMERSVERDAAKTMVKSFGTVPKAFKESGQLAVLL